MNKYAVALTVVSALAISACSKKAPEELPPPPQTSPPAPTPSQPSGPVPGTQAHFTQQMQGRDTIYFDTDKFDIDAEDQAALRQQAQYLQQYPNVRATVEGHADERGTREYNIALSARRATAAREFLIAQGVKGSPFGCSAAMISPAAPAARVCE